MRYSRLLLAAAVLLPAACQVQREGPAVAYRCTDGRVIQATYGDNEHALLKIDGTPHHLTIARSASGARYVGEGWQWWTRGMQAAWLAPLHPGETIASAPGVACRTR